MDEASALTGLAKSYLYKLTAGGVLPFSKPNGKVIFFDRERLENWMLSRSQPGSNERDVNAATYVAINSNH